MANFVRWGPGNVTGMNFGTPVYYCSYHNRYKRQILDCFQSCSGWGPIFRDERKLRLSFERETRTRGQSGIGLGRTEVTTGALSRSRKRTGAKSIGRRWAPAEAGRLSSGFARARTRKSIDSSKIDPFSVVDVVIVVDSRKIGCWFRTFFWCCWCFRCGCLRFSWDTAHNHDPCYDVILRWRLTLTFRSFSISYKGFCTRISL